MSYQIKVHLNEKLFVRNPNDTELGKRIITESILMIDELGFELFTFKKLAHQIESTEASIYRYFENKHRLLLYLISWYWVWLDFQMTFKTNNIKSPQERLRIIIQILSQLQLDDPDTEINESALYRIVVAESSKAYLTKLVDSANRDGLYKEYKDLCKKIACVILEIDSSCKYPHSLVTTIIEASHNQVFFANHLPSLTDIRIQGTDYSDLEAYLWYILTSTIQNLK